MVAPLTEAHETASAIPSAQGDLLLLVDPADTGPTAAIWGDDTELFAHLSQVGPDTGTDRQGEAAENRSDLDRIDPDLAEIGRRIRQSLLADPLPVTKGPSDDKINDAPLRWADTPVETEIAEAEGPAEAGALLPEVLARPETIVKSRSGFMKLFGGAICIARHAKNVAANRVSDTFAARDETSRRPSPRTAAVIAASAVLVGALGSVLPTPGTTNEAKTEQTAPANSEQELAKLISHMPKVENAPSGAWVPPSIKVWEDSVNKLLHAKELEPYNLLVDPQLILAIMTPSSLGDPNAKGHNGRLGLMQIPKEEGDPQYMKGYDPLSPRDSIVVGILDVDHREKIALAAKDYSNDRAGLIRAIIEGPEPGLGYEPVPAYAKALADRVIQLDANWSKPTNDGYNTWIADASVASLLNQAVTNLLDQGLLVRKK